MKKILIGGLGVSLAFVLLLISAVIYSPHFFIRHLLAGPLKDLENSGVIVSLVEPIPRKTVLHLSIPKLGVRDLALEPKLRFSFLPLSLDVEVEKTVQNFSLLETRFKTFSLKIIGRKLLSDTKAVEFLLGGIPDLKVNFEVAVKGQSKAFTNQSIELIGEVHTKTDKDHLKGTYDLNWNFEKPYPDVTLSLFTNVLETSDPIHLTLSTEGESPNLDFKWKEGRFTSLSNPLAFNGKGKLKFNEKQLHAVLTETQTNLKTTLKGQYREEKKDWLVQYSLPIHFDEEFQLFHLFPNLKKKVIGWEGDIDLKGTIQIKDEKIRAIADIAIEDLSGLVLETPFIHLKTSLNLQVYPTLISLKPFQITLQKWGDNLGLDDISLKASLTNTKINILDVRARLKDGLLLLRPVSIPRENYEGSYWVTLESMDLGSFLRAFKSERLSGQGKIDGVLPFRYLNQRLFIDDARLFNQGPGKIQYLDPSIADVKEKIEYLADFNDLLSRGQQALAYKALSDFHYSSLELRATRTGEEHLSVTVHLKGKNPHLAKGQPFEINLPISGNLESFLLDSLLKSPM